MKGLFKNDLIVNWKSIVFYVGVLLGASSPFFVKWSEDVTSESAIMLISKFLLIFSIYMVLNNLCNAFMLSSENKSFRHMIAASPTGIKGLITEKYLITLFFNIFNILWLSLAVFVQYKLIGSHNNEFYILYFCFFFTIFMQALELPFIFRYGAGYGKYYRIGFVLFLLIFFLIFLLYGPDILPSMDDVWDYMFNIYYSDFFKEKSTFIKVVPFITLGLYGISYAITILSVKSRFSRKEI